MNPHFSEWYSLVDIDPDRETLERRWEGVTSAAQVRSTNKWLDYVRIYNGDNIEDIEHYDDFVEHFRKEDPKFPSDENKLEARVLAGSAIHKKFKGRSSNADILSISILTSQLHSGDENILLPEVFKKASDYYSKRSHQVRSTEDRGSDEAIEAEHSSLKRVDSFGNNWKSERSNVRRKMNKSIGIIEQNKRKMSKVVEFFKKQEHTIKCLREETEVLWWLFGERSKDTEKPFEEIGVPGATIQLGKELADLTEMVPGPRSTKGILRKGTEIIAGDYKEVSIEKALDAVDEEWLQEWLEQVVITERISGLTPCITAAHSFCQSNENWKSLYENTPCRISPTTELSPPDLSYQVYLECLLLREVT